MKTTGKQHTQGKGKLIICPTPLGNLGDMPPRALQALQAADVVCCEDTRVTGKLLVALGVEGKRLERMDEATIRMPMNRLSMADGPLPTDDYVRVGDMLVARVLDGETIVYCSDAGMPGVSDPGQLLVQIAHENGVPVEVLPGPTAATTAYVASGFTCPRFYFGGFFPRKEAERKAVLDMVKAMDAASIFYESPKRLVACLQAIERVLPNRLVCVCRELSKLHEEVLVAWPADLLDEFEAREEAGGIKGEIVVVLDAPSKEEIQADRETALEAAQQRARELVAAGSLTKKEIVAQLQTEFGISRNAAYKLVHGV